MYRALLGAWAGETATPTSDWAISTPAKNHCSISALIFQDYFGGEILMTKTPGGNHFYNSLDGTRWDLTVSQFNEPIPYDDIPSTRDMALADTSEERYRLLLARVGGTK